ncbi:hypothetical protein [Nocardia shimofusensis]|uniref:hypothetical protein n=1 Tax=Nocardia shimofusensis TaxID=228596 RepID=UPI00082CFCF1|nr:hypothetical protein [Nocardia shimofusensis]
MPKNSSARRRRRARHIATTEGVPYREALRRGEQRATHAREIARRSAVVRPEKITVDGIEKYPRPADAEHPDPTGLADPTVVDVLAAAEAVLPGVQVLACAVLTPATVVVPDYEATRTSHDEIAQRIRATVGQALEDLQRVRGDAASCRIDWRTVAVAFYHVEVKLRGLERLTGGRLREQLDEVVEAAAVLSMTAEAAHTRGCRLGAHRCRHLATAYTPCQGEVRVRLRIYDDTTTVTVPGCVRHAAEHLVDHDYDIEEGLVEIEAMGGTTRDLDAIYDLTEQIRHERAHLHHQRARNVSGSWDLPQPPWHHGQDPD